MLRPVASRRRKATSSALPFALITLLTVACFYTQLLLISQDGITRVLIRSSSKHACARGRVIALRSVLRLVLQRQLDREVLTSKFSLRTLYGV